MRRRIVPRIVPGVAAVLALAATACGPVPAASENSAVIRSVPAPPASAPSSLKAVQDSFVAVVKAVTPSVVEVDTSEGLGSGVVVDRAGDIVTNYHVIEAGGPIKVVAPGGAALTATVLAAFPRDDLAILRTGSGHLTAARFASTDALQVGDLVLAVGNPLGLDTTVTDGIISSLGRTVTESGSGTTLHNVIQTSAPINPGNSGGALVDLNGDVVGIPTLGLSDPMLGGAAVGIGFAIPSSTVLADLNRAGLSAGR
jgi:putative serine protease PepD